SNVQWNADHDLVGEVAALRLHLEGQQQLAPLARQVAGEEHAGLVDLAEIEPGAVVVDRLPEADRVLPLVSVTEPEAAVLWQVRAGEDARPQPVGPAALGGGVRRIVAG